MELAGALCELSRDALSGDFRRIDSRDAQILLIESGDRVLPTYPEDLSKKAQEALEALGVTLRLGCSVEDIDGEGIRIRDGEREEEIPTRCPLWAAGVAPSPLARSVAAQAGIEPDRSGRIPVGADLTVEGHPEVFAIGDLARFERPNGEPTPGVAPVAIQQGQYAGRAIRRRATDRAVEPFRYRHRGDLATIGRSAGVADFGRLRFSGTPAWLLWLVVHIAFLVELENRALVLLQWTWNYVTRNRSTRIIAHAGPPRSRERERALSSAA